MKFTKIVCLLLALVLAVLCFAGCRKEEPKAEEVVEEVEEIEEVEQKPTELEVEDEPLVIEVPEGTEIDGG